MTSSKLSVRVATASKPSICLSIPPIIPNVPWPNPIYVQWMLAIPPHPPNAMHEWITPTQAPTLAGTWTWENPDQTPISITQLTIIIPDNASPAILQINAESDIDGLHRVVTEFPNPGPPPNSFFVNFWDYQSDPYDIIQAETPAP